MIGQMYDVTLITTNTNVSSSSFTTHAVMTHRDVMMQVNALTDGGLFTKVISGAGYDWDETHGRYNHFKYAWQWESPNHNRVTHVMFIRPVREECFCAPCTEQYFADQETEADRFIYANCD